MNNNLSERIHRANQNVLDICHALLDTPVVSADTLTADSVPYGKGVYLWSSKSNGAALYIGVALGKRGLRQRIINQHLSLNYTKSVFRKAWLSKNMLPLTPYLLSDSTTLWHGMNVHCYLCPFWRRLKHCLSPHFNLLQPKFNKKGLLKTI